MEFMEMRHFSEFCEQLHDMRLKFYKWDSCERTVALYYLMVGLPFANAKFLQYAIGRCVEMASTPEAKIQEKNANDPNFISSLLSENPQAALSMLLTHLPLLKPGNKEMATCYLTTIKRVLSEFITPPYRIYNECIEIMSYVFIHPAFDKNDKKTFRHLLKQVLNKVSPETFVHSPINASSDESVSPNPEPVPNAARMNRRSNSLTPGQTLTERQNWSSQENLTIPLQKPRSYSLSNDKTVLISIPPIQSSSSETRLQDLEAMKNFPIMKSIVSWLKSLRLHKYSWVFNNLSFAQMLSLDERTLENIGITKGARHKLLLNIGKLRERSALMAEIETEVLNGGDLVNALKKLKNILLTPLQVSVGEDLVGQFIKILGKVFTQILILRQPSEEIQSLFSSITERCETCEAFTDEQKHRVKMWQNQLLQSLKQNTFNSHNIGQRSINVQNQYQHTGSLQATYAQKSSSFPNVQQNSLHTGHRHSVGSVTLQNQLLVPPLIVHPDRYLNDVKSNHNGQHHVHFQQANEAEKNRKQLLKNLDIESSLESLCLQMTEHALGP